MTVSSKSASYVSNPGAAVEHVATPDAPGSQILAVDMISATAAQQPVIALVAHDPVRTCATVDLIWAAATLDTVVAYVALYSVFAGPSVDGVVARVAGQEVVAGQAAYEVVTAKAVQTLAGRRGGDGVASRATPAAARGAMARGKRGNVPAVAVTAAINTRNIVPARKACSFAIFYPPFRIDRFQYQGAVINLKWFCALALSSSRVPQGYSSDLPFLCSS